MTHTSEGTPTATSADWKGKHVTLQATDIGMDTQFNVTELGYLPTFVSPNMKEGPTYVLRTCEGCGRAPLKFTPLPGRARRQPCSICKKETIWIVVEGRV